jgi:hypothetical protein
MIVLVTEFAGIHHLGLTVLDAERSARWYRDVLNFYEVGRLGVPTVEELSVEYTPITSANSIPGAVVVVFRDPDNIQLELVVEAA